MPHSKFAHALTGRRVRPTTFAGEPPMTRPLLVTFDAYTALVDYERGLVPAVQRVCGGAVDAAQLARAWRSKQLEYAQISNSLNRERIPFRVLTRRALDYTLARAGVRIAAAQSAELEAAWDRLPLWPEAQATLAKLASRGYLLGLLSNGDVEMLHALVRGWGVEFDHVLASDQAGHYKPHPAIYALPTRILGFNRGEVLHVAGCDGRAGLQACGPAVRLVEPARRSHT